MRFCAAAALAVALASCAGNADRAAELLPDLDQAPPRAVSIDVEEGRERLVFLSAVENIGRGPLVVSGRRSQTLDAEMSAEQLVRRADGETTRYPLRVRMRFVVSETHRHWHLLGFERYELLTPAGEPVGADRKMGFCLGDRYDAQGSVRIPGEPERAVWTQECGRGQAERTRILQGISPGFGDDYVPRLEGQFIDVTELPPGQYVLVHRVDPAGEIREASEANNAASVLLELRRLASEPPTVTVLATCPGSDRCGT